MPIRVLHIISGDLWAGAEVQAFTLLRHLNRHEGVELHAALMNEGELCRRLRNEGIPVTVLDEVRLSSLEIVVRLRRLMGQVRPNVIHSHRIKENLLGTLANWTSVRAPLVRTVHGAQEHPTSWAKPLAHMRQLANRWTARHATAAVIAVSEPLYEELRNSQRIAQTKLVPNGVDFEEVRAQQEPAPFRTQNPDIRHIGFIGRLEAVKRPDLFLEIARELLVTAPTGTYRFHLFGDGSMLDGLIDQVEKLRLDKAVEFHGHTPHALRWLNGLDAVVICSDHEGLPMTLLECMAAGTRVVGHAIGGMTDILNQWPKGRCSTDHTAEGYATALEALLAQQADNADSAPNFNEYSADANAAGIMSIYSEASRHT